MTCPPRSDTFDGYYFVNIGLTLPNSNDSEKTLQSAMPRLDIHLI